MRSAGRRQTLKAKRARAGSKPVRVTRTPQDNRHRFDLVIFDCDGVLVDSEVISCRAHAEALTRHGYPITEQQVLERFLGVSDREARLIVEAELGRRLPDDFEAQIKQAALQRYPEELGGIPHIREAIAAIGLIWGIPPNSSG